MTRESVVLVKETGHSRAGMILTVAFAGWVMLTSAANAQPRDDRSQWPRGEAGEMLERVCAASRRCSSAPTGRHGRGDPRQELAGRLLEMPTLTDGHRRRDTAALKRLAGDPVKQFEYALNRAVELVGARRDARRWDREKRLRLIEDWLVTEYNAGYWSTLPDDLRRYEHTVGTIGQSGQHVAVSLNLSIENSWINGTFLLSASAPVQNGPATHFRLWCDQCEMVSTNGEWHDWADWNPLIVAVGVGYKNICIQVRAEPYQNNWENMAAACDDIGTPPSAVDDDDTELADANNPVQRCFGAIGNNCGAADEDGFDYGHCLRLHPFSDPDTATCQINAGSWEHDECCIEKRVGGNAPESEQGSCSPPMAAALNQPYVCEAEFNKAVVRITQGLTWTRDVNAGIENTSGIVDFALYCAEPGSIVRVGEVYDYCCSRSGVPYEQGGNDDSSDVRRVCL